MASALAKLGADLKALADAGELIAYVGYGSLVNIKTHRTPSIGAMPVQLNGWRRQWCLRKSIDQKRPALLSGIQCADSQIDALLVYDYATSLPSLDEREVFYERLELQPSDLQSQTPLHDCPIYIYRAEDLTPAQPEQNFLLQSYLDAVLQGHDVEFGTGAIERFVDTTDHWSIPVNRDRATPIYPRPVEIAAHEAQRFDELLESLIDNR